MSALTAAPDWFDQAECRRRELPARLFWPPPAAEGLVWVPDPRAISACSACPVREPCLEEADTSSNYRILRAGLVWNPRIREWVPPESVKPGRPRAKAHR